MKYLKKTLSFVLAFAMAFTMVIVPRGSSGSVADAAETTDPVRFFPVNLYNYHTEESDTSKDFNAHTDSITTDKTQQPIYFNDGKGGAYYTGASSYKKNYIQGTGESNPNATYERDNTINKYYNKWTGFWFTRKQNYYGNLSTEQNTDKLYPCTGLVKDSLSGSNIQFNVPEGGIFTNDDSEGTKEVYTDVGLPFKIDKDGYYYLDSNSYDVYFKDGKGASRTNLIANDSQKNMSLDSGLAANKGFFPFDGEGDTTPTYHFGMNMGVNFYLTQNGKTKNAKGVEKPITFEFSGDDDVWVFVDGKLVLDLGGIHNAISGEINFESGDVTVYRGLKGATNVKGVTTNNTYVKNLKNEGTSKQHSLQVFYLERGRGASNCKIKFNLPQSDRLEVAKVLGNTDATGATENKLKDEEYTYTLLKYNNTTKEYETCKDLKYIVTKDNTIVNENGQYDNNGQFKLKLGQVAIFNGVEARDKYKVIEESRDGVYNQSWRTLINGEQQNNGKTSETEFITIASNTGESTDNYANTYRFEFTNTYISTLNDDVVVLDYGKKVKINVLENDNLYGATQKVSSIKKDSNSEAKNSLSLDNGNVTIDNATLIYEPVKFMNSVDTLKYSVDINNVSEPYPLEANVSIMPANSVYYEDDFGKIQDSNSEKGDPSVSIVWKGKWDTDVNESGNEESDRYQDFNNEQRHGWDSHYVKDKEYSGGSAHYSSDYKATATFRFTGTDVDVYSRTNESVGKIIATITRVDEKASTFKPKTKIVNNLATSGDYHQVPTLNFSDLNLEYGTYEVKIQVDPVVDENGQFIYKKDESGNYVLDSEGNKILLKAIYYLDGIRVYNPLGVAPDDTRVENAYSKAGEYNALFKEVRDMLISADTFSNDANVEGAVFIDDINGQPVKDGKVSDFKTYGPENEVYLAKGQAIAFKIDSNYTGKAFIGLKSLEGKDLNVTVTNGEETKTINLGHTTDMYYEVEPTSQGYVVITNNTVSKSEDDKNENLLAITRLRLTGIQDTKKGIRVSSNAALVKYASDFSSLKTNKTDESGMIIGDDSGDVDIDNPENPEKPDEPENPEKPDDNKDHNTPNKIWNKLLEYIKHWFRR